MNSNVDNDESSAAVCIACTKAAAIVPALSSGISALSSALIILIIFCSSDRLSTIYHHIMLGLSIAGIFSSLSYGLTTLPLPKELPFDHPPYFGIRLGNTQTCEAQGFFYMFGFSAGLSYHVSLFIYNTCTIVFNMQEKNIIKCVEPYFLHLFPIVTGLYSSISPLVYKLYNPTKKNPSCLVALDEQNSNIKVFKILAASSVISVITRILVIIICSILITRKVFKLEKALSHPGMYLRSPSLNPGLNAANKSLQNTKVVFVHALAFLLAFLFTFGTIVIRFIYSQESLLLANLSFVLVPSQGLFNFVIFISHKVYNFCRVHRDMSSLDVIKMLLHRCEQEPVLFTRISMVQMFDDERRGMDVQISDEKDNNELIHVEFGENSLPTHSSAHLQLDDESERDHNISGFSCATEPRLSNDDEELGQRNDRESILTNQGNATIGSFIELSPTSSTPDNFLDRRDEIDIDTLGIQFSDKRSRLGCIIHLEMP